MNTENSHALYQRAKAVIPGGVNSPVRAWTAVGGEPLHVASAAGSKLVTEDGVELIDFCGSWGPLILGHAHPAVVEAVAEKARSGLSFGAPTAVEVEMAETICGQANYLEAIRLVNSGTEAVMTALRLARGFTGREKILKFSGCYHGHTDFMLVSAGSGLLTAGTASSAGVPESCASQTVVAGYNDLESVRALISKFGDDIAAIIVEPIAGNMGLVKPEDGFLEGLREAANSCGAVLIFDEVITGFRLAPTTYGTISGVTPDLTCLGKIIGGGMPIGAVGGRKAIMNQLAPLGDVYQAGTLSGNPIAVTAGLTTLGLLITQPPYEMIEAKAKKLQRQISSIAGAGGGRFHCAVMGGMFTIFFTSEMVHNLGDAKTCDTDSYARFFHHMLEHGIYIPPSQFEVCFISAAHTDDDVDRFIDAVTTYTEHHRVFEKACGTHARDHS